MILATGESISETKLSPHRGADGRQGCRTGEGASRPPSLPGPRSGSPRRPCLHCVLGSEACLQQGPKHTERNLWPVSPCGGRPESRPPLGADRTRPGKEEGQTRRSSGKRAGTRANKGSLQIFKMSISASSFGD